MSLWARVACPLSALLLWVVGCGEVGGEGVLRLVDLSENHDGSLSPLAAGTTTRFRVGRSASVGNGLALTDYEASDPQVLSVESADQRELRVVAKAPGNAELSVEVEGGDTDTFALEVQTSANAFFTMSSMKGGSTRTHGGSLATDKLNLPPTMMMDANLRYYVGESGRRLSGEGGEIAFGEAETTGSFRAVPRQNSEGRAWAFTAGADGDSCTIPSPYGGAWKLRAKEAVEPATLKVFSGAAWTSGQLPVEDQVITAKAGTTVALTFQIVDAEGFMYLGDYQANASVRFEGADGFMPRLGSGLSPGEDLNHCTEPFQANGIPQLCRAWEKLEQLRFTVGVPQDASETSIEIRIGDFQTVYTLRVAAD